MSMGGGGGGGGSTQFKAQGAPPGFDYSTAMGLQQLATGADIQSYALSDLDFANRYPALQSAYDQFQASLNQQVPGAATGQAGLGQIMQGLGGNILGRQGVGTTADINALRAQAGATASAAQPIFNLGATQAGLAQPITQLGQQQAALSQPITGIGTGINRMGQQLGGAAQIPYQVGQQLLNEPIDPITQQQMMRAGLTGAAGAFGAGALGQGMAGQAAAARQLGLSTLQYGQAMRGEAMGDINQYASMLGAAGQMRGLGAQTLGLGGSQLQQGAGTIGLGGQQLGGAGQLYGLGAQAATQAGGLYGSAQNLQEQQAMNTASMAGIYGGLQAQQNQQLLAGIGTAGQLFQKRPFGLGGVNAAQTELGQTGAYNSFQQSNYATMNGIAFNSAQMAAQQQQLQAQQSAGMMSAGVGAATSVATTAATIASMTCWVARAVYTHDNRWKIFRHWLLNKAPSWFRRLYLRHGQAFSRHVYTNFTLRFALRLLMDRIVEKTAYVGCPC